MNIRFRNLEEVKALIVKMGLSIRGFGKLAGISNGHINKILNGERQPTPVMAKRIADALGKDFDEIFYVEIGCKSKQSA